MGNSVELTLLNKMEPFINSGRPPYPLVSQLNADELEYLTQYLDNYQAGVSSDGVGDLGEIIGFLQEFKEQQYSGKTDFKLPKV